MNRSEDIKDLIAALVKAQAAMTTVGKDNKARIETKAGGAYTYAYADLATCFDMLRRPLADNGLALIQTPTFTDHSVDVETTLAHVSGQWVSCAVSVPLSGDIKAAGSAITYGRRYGLCLIGVVTGEDDDGAEAERRQPARPVARQSEPPPDSYAESAPLLPSAKPEAKPSRPPSQMHWIEDDGTRARFWKWTGDTLGLSNTQVHEALGVEHVDQYAGSQVDAVKAIQAYATARKSQVPA